MAKNIVTVETENGSVELRMISITPEIRRESQKYYSKAFKEACDAEMPFKAEVTIELEERGLTDSSKDEQKSAQIRADIYGLEKELRSARNADGSRMTREQGRTLALRIRDLRRSLTQIGNDKSDLYNSTVENYASNEQMQYLIFACAIDSSTGNRFWPSFEDFKNDTDSPVYEVAVREFLRSAAGIDKDWESSFYEIQWLTRMGFMNSEGQLIDSSGRTIDEEGRLIDSEGRYINENGEFINIYGDRVDENGNLLIEDGWADTDFQLAQ